MQLSSSDTPRLLEPALWALDPGRERYRVPATGAIAIDLYAGDSLTLVSPEGLQSACLAATDNQGKDALDALGLTANCAIQRLQQACAGSREAAVQFRAGLKRRDINLTDLRAADPFGPESRAGDSAEMTCQRDITLLVAAPGEPIKLDDITYERVLPASDLTLWVTRATRPEAGDGPPLPEPLAAPRLDIRIDRMTAQSYEVFAGETVQIIDVAGRECSDFQAFDRRSLDQGIEREIDLTATRTLLGGAYPGPGLHSKYFDSTMQPLLEVIRDTVGRHDTYGFACAARYYEDLGYFGHPNCSDNFSTALAAQGVQSRIGWQAVNLFFNTRIDDDNVLYSDEPWSRPGDYVLMQAATDLVCATSACPDDTSAANGWNPTDIHVRVYPAKNSFSKAIAYRMKPDSEPVLTRETGFHPRTSDKTRNFVEYKGFWLPSCFNNHGAEAEYYTCRQSVIMTDLSPLRKFEVLGPDAEALMQWALTRNVKKLAHGQVVYTAMCYANGGMLDDGTLFRLGPDNFRWIGGDEFGGEWLRQQAQERGLDRVTIKSATDSIHNVAVQGPNSREVLKDLIWTPPAQTALEELGWFRFCVGRIGGYSGIPVMVSRTGYSGELGYEVFCHPDDAPAVWDAIWEKGEAFGIAPLGLDALDMLRIEAGLVFAGSEFCDQTDPFEAGIGFTVPLKSKTDDFMGRDALLERKAHPQRKLVGLELQGNEPAAHGDCVHVGRAQTGTVTSATRSPVLNKNIALCRMDIPHTEPGTQVEVGKLDGHQKRIPATVVPFPFYDPDKSRVRA